ncbi:MAG: hypothetical protein J5I98_04320, partial [Phaeodactylibacter sp.]|nr:hypothetical protein [Phaeodactylibacter sp.]
MLKSRPNLNLKTAASPGSRNPASRRGPESEGDPGSAAGLPAPGKYPKGASPLPLPDNFPIQPGKTGERPQFCYYCQIFLEQNRSFSVQAQRQ